MALGRRGGTLGHGNGARLPVDPPHHHRPSTDHPQTIHTLSGETKRPGRKKATTAAWCPSTSVPWGGWLLRLFQTRSFEYPAGSENRLAMRMPYRHRPCHFAQLEERAPGTRRKP